MKMKLIFLILLMCLLFINNVSAETIIYDNITTSQYKTITINDDLNYKFLTDYKYDVYINGNFAGKYAKDELIYIPNDSNILIYVPAPVSLDYSTAWDLGKTSFAIAIMFLLAFGITIIFIIYVIKRTLKTRR